MPKYFNPQTGQRNTGRDVPGSTASTGGRLRSNLPALITVKNALYLDIVRSDPDAMSSGFQTSTVGRSAQFSSSTAFRPTIGSSRSKVNRRGINKIAIADIRAGREFPLRVQTANIIAKLNLYTEASIKLAILEILDILVNTTPFDTGWASASWFPASSPAPQDNGGYLIGPDDQQGTLESLAANKDVSNAEFLREAESAFGNPMDPSISPEQVDESVSAFMERHPEFQGGAAGDIFSFANEAKLKERQAKQNSQIIKFRRSKVIVNGAVVSNPSVSNRVPYIGNLNAGGSKQTPRGFVQRAVLQGLLKLELTVAARGAAPRGSAAPLVARGRALGSANADPLFTSADPSAVLLREITARGQPRPGAVFNVPASLTNALPGGAGALIRGAGGPRIVPSITSFSKVSSSTFLSQIPITPRINQSFLSTGNPIRAATANYTVRGATRTPTVTRRRRRRIPR